MKGMFFGSRLPRKQRGVVLIVSLVVLVAMMLAGVALMRSVETNNVIAGNMAFLQGASIAGDAGIAEAVAQLNAMTKVQLETEAAPTYYHFRRALDANGQLSSIAYDPNNPTATPAALDWSTIPVARTVDGVYQVRLVMDRLCNGNVNNCIRDPVKPNVTPTVGVPPGVGPIHYRATIQVTGPRNTVSVAQTTLTVKK